MARKSTVGIENREYIRAMNDLRRSSAASPHTRKKYKGTRAWRDRRAIEDSSRAD